MKKLTLLVLMITVLCHAMPQTSNGVALVIANGNYTSTGDVLRNAIGDGKAVAERLTQMGFQTTLATNLDQSRMMQTIEDFAALAQKNKTVVFYYTGHGLQGQSVGEIDNYMVPVDVQLNNNSDIVKRCISLSLLCDLLRSDDNEGQRLLFFDACRSMTSTPDSYGMKTKDYDGFWTLFATSTGSTADDGNNQHSPYTQAWLETMRQNNISAGTVATRIARRVSELTGGRQQTILVDRGNFTYSFRTVGGNASPNLNVIVSQGIYKNEIDSLNQEVKAGKPDALLALGKAYETGHGVCPDPAKAMELYEKAAGKGNAEALYRLGDCYEEGFAGAIDNDKATKYYLKSAKKDYIPAMLPLARLYNSYGGGDAGYWCQRAADMGDIEAQYRIAKSIYAPVPKAARSAEKFAAYKRAADNGHVGAMNELGYCYLNGIGTEQNYDKAFELFSRAAEHASAGNYDGIYNLAYCYGEGKGVEKDLEKAIYWADKGIQFGNHHCDELKSKLLKLKEKENINKQQSDLTSENDTEMQMTLAYHGAALVIANSDYFERSAVISSPARDGEAVAERLTKLGFRVTKAFNLTGENLKKAIDEFNEKNADSPSTVIYYAGHGVQARHNKTTENYIVPVDASIHNSNDILRQCISVDYVNTHLSNCPNKVFFFDACRVLPTLHRSVRNLTQNGHGMAAQSYSGAWSLFAVGEADNETELTSKPSAFALAWLDATQQKNLSLGEIASLMTAKMTADTKGRQHVAIGSTASFRLTMNHDNKQTPAATDRSKAKKHPEPKSELFGEDASAEQVLAEIGYVMPSDSDKLLYKTILQWEAQGEIAEKNGDTETAKAKYRQAADRGNPEAMYRLGRILYLEEDYSSTVALCREALKQNDNIKYSVYNLLGCCYREGNGVAVNDSVAWDYFSSASLRNNKGLYNMAMMVYRKRDPHPHGAEYDFYEVRDLLERAAKDGLTDAWVTLGQIYGERGDSSKEYECYRKAELANNENGKKMAEKFRKEHPSWFN